MRALVLPLLLVVACAPAIPEVRMDGPRADVRALPVLAPCTLTGFRAQRPLAAAINQLDFQPWNQSITSVAFKRPEGWVIIDPAFGHEIDEDLRKSPPWFGAIMGRGEGKRPLLGLLSSSGIPYRDVRYALVTHAHWDHVGALRDLSVTKVRLPTAELAFARAQHGTLGHGVMPQHVAISDDRFEPFEFDGGPYEGFEHSHDVFGDGSVVAVPLPGHTPGSTGYFLNSGDGRRWLLIGDTAWANEGVVRPAHKMPLIRPIVDGDLETLSVTLGKLHDLSQHRPDLMIVPAHDADANARAFPECPASAR